MKRSVSPVEFASASVGWLSNEVFSLAQNLGVSSADAESLRAFAGALAETLLEKGETSLRVTSRRNIKFLRHATETAPLNLIAGTPETFDSGRMTPLIFDAKENVLYFSRHYKQEVLIARRLLEKKAVSDGNDSLLSDSVQKIIDAEIPFSLNAEQKNAVRAILSNPFTIISGGPGTGKTTLLLRALLCIFSRNPEASVLLAAPTGKASVRMRESILAQIDDISKDGNAFPAEALRKASALESATLHRILRVGVSLMTISPPPKIDADFLIVDEASMIDQALMYRLVRALAPHTRLVLLGDKNQLDSVGAGRIFGALCAAKPFESVRVELIESRRFAESGVPGMFARAVVRGDVDAAGTLISDVAGEDVRVGNPHFSETDFSGKIIDDVLEELFPAELKRVPEDASPESVLRAFESVRLLTSLRSGPLGADALNERARRIFAPTTLTQPYFHGQPIIITRNAPQERLYNGDLGVVLWDSSASAFFAYFRNSDGLLRKIPVAALPEHDTSYVMSVHKSQGSEFSRLCVIFPAAGKHSEFFSRQLLYTAVTRFREGGENTYFKVLFNRETLLGAVAREISRKPLCF